jgi:hypothetical protein
MTLIDDLPNYAFSKDAIKFEVSGLGKWGKGEEAKR